MGKIIDLENTYWHLEVNGVEIPEVRCVEIVDRVGEMPVLKVEINAKDYLIKHRFPAPGQLFPLGPRPSPTGTGTRTAGPRPNK